MKNIIVIMILIWTILISCINTNSVKSGNLIPRDSLRFCSLYEDMSSSTTIIGDTLKFITTNPIAYYPLGKFENVNEMINKFKFSSVEKEFQYPNNDSALQRCTLYNLTSKESKIKVFVSTEKTQVNIVSGMITDKSIEMTNGIEVGQSKSDVIRKFYSRLPENYADINVIELDSGLEGIWHYYNFANDLLVSIKFDTDYQFKK